MDTLRGYNPTLAMSKNEAVMAMANPKMVPIVRPSAIPKKWAQFTANERAYVENYIANGMNKSKAFRDAYPAANPKDPNKSARVVHSRPHITAEINARLDNLVMSETEVLARTAAVGRSDIGEALVDYPVVCPKCRHEIYADGDIRVSIQKLQELGLTHMIKRVTSNKDGTTVVELYPADEARRDIMKSHGMFKSATDEAAGGLVELLGEALRRRRNAE